MKLGYLLAVFPHLGHLWLWREICWMRAWNLPFALYCTRPPEARDRARHGWADEAAAQTTYLHPMGAGAVLTSVLVNLIRSPIGFWRCIWLGLTIQVNHEQRPRWRHTLPLIIPACRMADLARRDGITHLHTHTAAKGAIICMMVQRLAGIPWSMIVNAHIEWWGGAMAEKFTEADHTFFVTQWMVEQMQRDYPQIPQNKYSLCRVGVDTRKWKPDLSSRAARSTPRVVSVGRLVSSKCHHDVIRAMKILKDQGVAAELKIGGEGPERAALESLIKELDVADRVELLGNLSEERYLDLMNNADVFVLASAGEPMGVVYMEAQAMEVPAIGCNALGAKELIEDKRTGLLVPPQSPADLASAIAQLVRDPQQRRRMGQAGRRRVLEQFDSRIWAQKLYEYLMHSPPPEIGGTYGGLEADQAHTLSREAAAQHV